MQKTIKITINGKTYSIATDEAEENVQYAANLVDTLLKDKISKFPPGEEARASLIVALQLATDLAKNQKLLNVYEQRVKDLSSLLGSDA